MSIPNRYCTRKTSWPEKLSALSYRLSAVSKQNPSHRSQSPVLRLGKLAVDAAEGLRADEGDLLVAQPYPWLLVDHLDAARLQLRDVAFYVVGIHAEVVDPLTLLPNKGRKKPVLAVVLDHLHRDRP